MNQKKSEKKNLLTLLLVIACIGLLFLCIQLALSLRQNSREVQKLEELEEKTEQLKTGVPQQ